VTASPCVLVENKGAVCTLTINRPEKRNALSTDVLLALRHAQSQTAEDEATRVVVLAARGPVFSSGHDLKDIAGASKRDLERLFGLCSDVMLGFRRLPQPVVARVHGLATAAGCQLATSADLIIASDHAAFATPGVQIGLFCTTPMVPLARMVPPKIAMEMLLTGQPLSAQRAYEAGLVNQVVPESELDSAVETFANRLAQKPRAVVALGKRAFYSLAHLSEADAYESAQGTMVTNAQLPEATEGMDAFLGKRQPNWQR